MLTYSFVRSAFFFLKSYYLPRSPNFLKKARIMFFWVRFYAISLSSKHSSCSYRAERMATWYNEKLFPLSINLIFFIDTPLLLAASERVLIFSRFLISVIQGRLCVALKRVCLLYFWLGSFSAPYFFHIFYKNTCLKIRQAELKNCQHTVAVIQYITGTPPFPAEDLIMLKVFLRHRRLPLTDRGSINGKCSDCKEKFV